MAILLIEAALNIKEINQVVLGAATRKRIGLRIFHVPDAESYAYTAVNA